MVSPQPEQGRLVEDVLVLFRERIVRHSYLIHRTRLVQPGPPAAVNEPVEVKSVFLFIGLRRISLSRHALIAA